MQILSYFSILSQIKIQKIEQEYILQIFDVPRT